MSAKFTKGPWECDEGLVDAYDKQSPITPYHRDESALHEPIAIIPHDDITDEGYEEVKANARLIAAAPDLYEALSECLGALTGGLDGKWSEDADPAAMARAALRKADGEQS